MTLDHKIYMK